MEEKKIEEMTEKKSSANNWNCWRRFQKIRQMKCCHD